MSVYVAVKLHPKLLFLSENEALFSEMLHLTTYSNLMHFHHIVKVLKLIKFRQLEFYFPTPFFPCLSVYCYQCALVEGSNCLFHWIKYAEIFVSIPQQSDAVREG